MVHSATTTDSKRESVPSSVNPADQATRQAAWVVVAAFREARTIGAVVSRLVGDGWRVVVVDDGSDDDTAGLAHPAGAWVLRHGVNVGQGAALSTGFAFAQRDPAMRFVLTFDADGQHDAAALPRLLAPLASGSADVTLGSRFLDPDSVRSIPRIRRFLLRVATWLARSNTGMKLTDTHNGMRGFRREALSRLVLRQDRMAHASEILAEVGRLQLRVQEVAVHVSYTDYSLAKGQRLIDAVSVVWDLLIAKTR